MIDRQCGLVRRELNNNNDNDNFLYNNILSTYNIIDANDKKKTLTNSTIETDFLRFRFLFFFNF